LKKILALLLLSTFALSASAIAAENKQNTKMSECQAQAGEKIWRS